MTLPSPGDYSHYHLCYSSCIFNALHITAVSVLVADKTHPALSTRLKALKHRLLMRNSQLIEE
jgi:hypothetical protein